MPFVDEKRLFKATQPLLDQLTPEEREYSLRTKFLIGSIPKLIFSQVKEISWAKINYMLAVEIKAIEC